jgi:hypothetical protein
MSLGGSEMLYTATWKGWRHVFPLLQQQWQLIVDK